MSVRKTIYRLQNPSHTGENRCWRCTVVNLVIALVGSTVVGIVWTPILGVGGFSIGAAIIYSQGYLVPKTPQLTQRYFPASLWTVFHSSTNPQRTSKVDFHVASILTEECVITHDNDGGDFELTTSFQTRWEESITSRTRTELEEWFANYLDSEMDVMYVSVEDRYRAILNGRRVGEWESASAFIIHITALKLLQSELDRWDSYSQRERNLLVGALRVFTPCCPCWGSVTERVVEVESCCDSRKVFAFVCSRCDSRLFALDESSTTQRVINSYM